MDIPFLSTATIIEAFLLAFPALFSIVNPIGSALIFNQVTAWRPASDRHRMASRIAVYAMLVLLVSVLLGGYVLAFFGVSINALRIAGGLVVTVRAWELLMQPESLEKRKADEAEPAMSARAVTFFPLTMPLTTGPGTIAVAVALASQRPATGPGSLAFFCGVSLAAAAISLVIWGCYRWADSVTARLGSGGARVMSRLVSFLLLCVGVQIIVTGIVGIADLASAGHQ